VDRYELEKELVAARVHPNGYSIWGDQSATEAFVLEKERDGRWSVYYAEHGEKSGLCYFPSEDAACRYVLDQLLKSSWRGWSPNPTHQK
jgi:hypothetical protein